MNTVKVKIEDALAALEENRQRHVEEYEEARDSFIDRAKSLLEESLVGLGKSPEKVLTQRGDLSIELEAPVSRTEDYDEWISRLEHHNDECVELDFSQFNSVVNDKWRWSEQFSHSYTSYTGKISRG